MMNVWNVTVEFAGEDSDLVPEDLVEPLDNLLELLQPYAGVVLGPPESSPDGLLRYGADVSVEALTATEAVTGAVSLVEEYAGKVGLPILPVARIEAKTAAELDTELARPAPAVVGVSELAVMVGVSRQRASALAHQAGFPEPLAVLANGPVWLDSDVVRFVAEWPRRPGRPSKAS